MMKRYYADSMMNRHATELFLRNRHSWELVQNKRVLIAGAGGLGNFVLAGIVGSGVKEVHVVDRDIIEPHNLNRQFFYSLSDIGREKASVIEAVMRYRPAVVKGIKEDVRHIDISDYDVVFDCLDDWDVKMYLLQRALRENIPYVLMSVGEGVGLVSVPKKLLPIKPRRSRHVSTPEIMVTAGIGVEEGLRILTGEGPHLLNKILFIDIRKLSFLISEI